MDEAIMLRSEGRLAAVKPVDSTAAIGFRAHSGWAALIAISGPPDAPRVLERRRIELCDPHDAHGTQPYHAAELLEFTQAQKLVSASIDSSQKLALQAVQSVITNLDEQGHQVASAAMLCASGRPLPDLSTILASHSLIHTAEGELFRDALVRACTECGLSVMKIKERELVGETIRCTGLSETKLEQHLIALGKQLGPPWRQDEKFATLAAWAALAAARNSAQRASARAM